MNKTPKIYKWNQIQLVYKRHHKSNGSVLYSEDGFEWDVVSNNTTLWRRNWLFTFIELTDSGLINLLNEEINHDRKNFVCSHMV